MPRVTQRQLHHAIRRLPPAQTKAARVMVRRASDVGGLAYIDDDGSRRIIDLAFQPWLMTRAQRAFYGRLAGHIRRAMQQSLRLYLDVPAARALLPLLPMEHEWVCRVGREALRYPRSIFGRIDSNAFYGDAQWRQVQFLEANGVGVGGIHYAPTAQAIMRAHLLRQPGLQRVSRQITMGPDPRLLLEREWQYVLAQLQRRGRSVALLENKDYATGTDEFASLAAFFRARGWTTQIADPREFEVRRGELWSQGQRVDVVYRDCELREFDEIQSQGRHRLTAMQHALRRGQMISSLTGEFDHKSLWEVLTTPAFQRYCTPTQRRTFQQYLLWTRLLRDARVTDATGGPIDLLRYVRRARRHLVIKPNRSFGGTGVVLGRTVTQAAWERAIQQALCDRHETYVVQHLAALRNETLPIPRARERWSTMRRYVVSGFFVGEAGMASVGRFCSAPVVNVSQGGGLIAVLGVKG